MLSAAHRLNGLELARQCDIAAIPNSEARYYESVKDSYVRQYVGDRDTVLNEISEQSKAAPSVLKSESSEAKYAVMNIFAMAKGKVH